MIGTGVWIWQVKQMFGGNANAIDPLELAAQAQERGYTHVIVNVADGVRRYNLRPPLWTDDILPALFDALRGAGIKVLGFHFVYGNYPGREAQVANARIEGLQMDGFVVNAESQYYNKRNQAQRYMDSVRLANPDLPIYLSTFRFPTLHAPFPFREFLDRCSPGGIMPQVYWQGATNPAAQLARSLREFEQLGYGQLEYVPTGPAYREHGWQPSIQELVAFHFACLELDLQAANWWRWGTARSLGFEDTIAGFEWPEDGGAPGTVPLGEWAILVDEWARNPVVRYDGPMPPTP